jgi:hypothetical protein
VSITEDSSIHVVLVFGYGCHLVPEYQEYLDRVKRFCDQNHPEVIVFCGGRTQRKTAPGVSEARVMHDYVMPQLSDTPTVHLEDDSFTTLDNARLAAELLSKTNMFPFRYDRFTVFSEATRAAEVDMVVRRFFRRRATIETASWEQMAPEKRIASMIWTWLSLRFPSLAEYRRRQRIERSFQI